MDHIVKCSLPFGDTTSKYVIEKTHLENNGKHLKETKGKWERNRKLTSPE